MINTEKLHQAYHLHTENHHDPRGEELYKEVEPNKLQTANDLQVYGYLALEFGEIHKAVKALQQSIKKDNKTAQSFLLLGIAQRRLKEYSKAIAAFRQALKLEPKTIDAIYNLGITLDDAQNYESAIDVLEKGLDIAPKDTDLLNAIAGASVSAGYTEDAVEYYRQAIDLEPNFAPFQYNLSQVLLQIGEWAEGWKLFDSRLAFRNQSLNPKTDASFWKGENLEGKSVLVWNEQGFGDSLQFVRYIPLLKQKGAKVYLRIQPALKRLMEHNFEEIEAVFTPKEDLPTTDFQIPIMSLPQFFGKYPITLQESIVKVFPSIETNLKSNFKNQISKIQPKLSKVGIVWSGNPNHPDDQKRSIPARFYSRLLKLKNFEWYSLQMGRASNDLKHPQLTDLTSSIEDFADTAVQIEALDLVISVDTAVAHLAGSMNKKVWLLLDYAPDWRWGMEEAETNWYSSMQIFRQSKVGDWNGVMNKVLKELKREVAGG
ncbi:MAG: tetratricopeptide repeat protein [Chitinophagales bacterium]